MARPADRPSAYELIYAVVRRIPRGRVATYGQVAELAGLPGRARQVGYALHALEPTSRIPWHRVVNAQGRLSPRSCGDGDVQQAERLAVEGVVVTHQRLDLARYRW